MPTAMDQAFQNTLQDIGLSLLLGLLVGLQRQRAESVLAGVRTFPLITVLGTFSSLLAQQFGGWVLAAGFLGVAMMVLVGNLARLRQGHGDTGTTTEFAILLMFAVGAYLVIGSRVVGVAAGVGVAVLLQMKTELHGFAARLGDNDVKAIMQFALITFIVLPILPDSLPLAQARLDALPGPVRAVLGVINPFKMWLMVVLIVGINLGGYVSYKSFGRNAGTLLGGVLGGAISSTATTFSYSRRVAASPDGVNSATVAIVVASAVVYLRVLTEVLVVAPSFLKAASGPIAVMMALTVLPAIGVWWAARGESSQMPAQENPTELKAAVVFGLMYTAVLVALSVADRYFGNEGRFTVAALSGLTDMDAITLSTSNLVVGGDPTTRLDHRTGWQMIVVATMANLLFKSAVVAVIGHRRLFTKVAALFAFPILGGAAMLAFSWWR